MKMLLIGTPCYNGMLHVDYFNSIMNLYKEKIQFATMCLANESLITRARNTLISYFYHNKDFTHLLFLDGDIGIPFGTITKLLSHNKNIIGVPIALKGFDENGNKVYNVGKLIEDCGDLCEVDRVGTGCLLISRKVVEDIIKVSDKYKKFIPSRGEGLTEIDHYDVFKTGVFQEDYLSEDFWFCMRMRSLGYSIYIDRSINAVHNGMYVF